jgi:hypothetical protein
MHSARKDWKGYRSRNSALDAVGIHASAVLEVYLTTICAMRSPTLGTPKILSPLPFFFGMETAYQPDKDGTEEQMTRIDAAYEQAGANRQCPPGAVLPPRPSPGSAFYKATADRRHCAHSDEGRPLLRPLSGHEWRWTGWRVQPKLLAHDCVMPYYHEIVSRSLP